jgi:hypothetical protein
VSQEFHGDETAMLKLQLAGGGGANQRPVARGAPSDRFLPFANFLKKMFLINFFFIL